MNRQMNKIDRLIHAIASSRPLVVTVIHFNLTRLRNNPTSFDNRSKEIFKHMNIE